MRLDLAYDGTLFSGWAAQRDVRTVQSVLEQSLATLCRGSAGTPLRLTVAGRTDAGVHARGQVAHVDAPRALAEDDALARRLNGLLPKDVRLLRATPAPAGFDARFSALSRTYVYRIADQAAAMDPLARGHTLWWPRLLDVSVIAQAASDLLGEHDFAAFCRRRDGATTRRTLQHLSTERAADGVVVVTVQADAFCHSMVRSMVGALVAVGEGRRPWTWPAGLLSRQERASEVVVAPAHGLVLEHVDYPPDDQLLARQDTTRQRRAAPPSPSGRRCVG